MNSKQKFIQYVIDIVNSCGEKMTELENKIKVYKQETLDVITLIPLLGANHRQPILHMYKKIVQCYSIDESINQFEIGYMINPPLICNKLF